jgi:DNA-binding Lrp family transcriptional regulator
MNPVLKLLIEGGHLTTAQMAQVAGISESEVGQHLEQLRKDGVFLGWRPVLDLSRESAAAVRAVIEVKITPERGGGLQPAGRAPEPLRRGRVLLPDVGRLRPAHLRQRPEPAEGRGFVSEKLSTLEGVLSTSTHFMLRSYKEGSFLMDAPAQETERLKVSP